MQMITYGVLGLIDWKAVISIGKATLNIHFKGGATTKYGITPAEYSTSDEALQKIIEQSDYYKQGRIVRLRYKSTSEKDLKVEIGKEE